MVESICCSCTWFGSVPSAHLQVLLFQPCGSRELNSAGQVSGQHLFPLSHLQLRFTSFLPYTARSYEISSELGSQAEKSIKIFVLESSSYFSPKVSQASEVTSYLSHDNNTAMFSVHGFMHVSERFVVSSNSGLAQCLPHTYVESINICWVSESTCRKVIKPQNIKKLKDTTRTV